jgi:hypothetical protein
MRNKAGDVIFWAFVIFMAYISVASVVWQFRNPKANKMTTFTHFQQVITFQKNEAFQK